MSAQTRSQIERLVGEISIAAISSWLKTKRLPFSAASRTAIVDRLQKLLGKPKDSEYRLFYLAKIRQLLACSLNAIDLRPILKSLSEQTPRPIELVMNKVRTAHDSKMRITNRSDIRDDPDWKAAQTAGGNDWAHEEGAGEWLASASSQRISRNLFTEIDAVNGTLRFLADCHESELNYAISRIAEI